jgi:signal peptidase II
VEHNQLNPSSSTNPVANLPATVLSRHLIAILVALLCFVLDMASKTWARASLSPQVSQWLLPPLLKLTLTTNCGAAFSLGEDHAQVVIIFSTAVFALLLIWSCRRYRSITHPFLEELGMAIILGAALGNLVDRYTYGRVTDFLEFASINFPVFNLADVLIDVGVGLVLIAMLRKRVTLGKL